MDNAAIIFVLFIRAGFAFSAVVLLLSYWWVPRLRPSVPALSQAACGLVGFYALCAAMLGAVSLVRAHALPWTFVWKQLVPLLAIAVLYLTIRKRPLWLLIPFALLINISLFRTAFSGQPEGNDQLLLQLWSVKPYILLLMGLLYLLLVFVFYLLGIWLRRILQEGEAK
ncbi:hypothetical protein [Dinghuibacter silviterrae]|uniref:Uncharacterized protein n=1 Tax=Dinghuibacter silviterrae TaxID=1539049 RepID=A0A4R8DPY8_9BACT|nr:hypothetical protein [Dinghuibacter silviterrae]TDX00174.1 hypothetical protein EDB95_1191 [Dinghuibacter silviterrae]